MRIPRDNDKLIAEGKVPHTAHIYLDGVLITHAHEVDDKEGWVKTLMHNDKDGVHPVVREGRVLILFPGDVGYGPYSFGQDAFEAYNKDRGGVNFKGDKTPEWDELPEEIRHAWEMGAAAVINIFVDQDGTAHKLEALFFDLLRDHVPAGALYKIVKDMEEHPPPYKYGDEFSPHLGKVARHLAQRVLAVKDQGEEPKAEGGGITNRERWITRKLFRNSYERDELEIDGIIVGVLRDVDVDAMHNERLEQDAEIAKTKDW